jgi:hypothetical protein
MKKSDFVEMAKALFKSYPTVNEFFFTSDGNAFEHRHVAESHAVTLKSKLLDVTIVTRQDAEQPEPVTEIVTTDNCIGNDIAPDDSGTTSMDNEQAPLKKKKN